MRTGWTQQVPSGKPRVIVAIYEDRELNTLVDIFYSYWDGFILEGDYPRVVGFDFTEEVWGGNYVIELDNSDSSLVEKDYVGYWVKVSLGYEGGSSPFSDMHLIMVEGQSWGSGEGNLNLQLKCIDMLSLLSKYKSNVGYEYYNHFSQSPEYLENVVMPRTADPIPEALQLEIANNWQVSVKDIVERTLARTTGASVVGWTDDAGLDSTPFISAGDARSSIVQALTNTKTYIRHKGGTANFESIVPDDPIFSTYIYDNNNKTYSVVDGTEETTVNTVIYYGLDPEQEGGDRLIVTNTGTGRDDPDSHGVLWDRVEKVGHIYEHNNFDLYSRELLTSQEEVDEAADGAINRYRLGANSGYIIAPMHCSQQLLDKVQFNDGRYDGTRMVTGYVFGIKRTFRNNEGVYEIELRLGGTASAYTPGDGEEIDVVPITPVVPPQEQEIPEPEPLPPWEDYLPRAVQGYDHDIVFTTSSNNYIYWTEGDIKFYDGTTQAINSGGVTLTTNDIYYIYFDLEDDEPKELKISKASEYPMTLSTAVLCVVQRGTGGRAVVYPGKEKQPLIVTDMIYMSGLLNEVVPEVLDYTDGNGAVIPLLMTSEFTAGKIKLTGSTLKDGLWYNEGGVIMQAGSGGGVRIYGSGVAFATFKTEDDAKNGSNAQCYMGSNGEIMAGGGGVSIGGSGISAAGGGVVIDNNGISVTSGSLRLIAGGSVRGTLDVSSNGFALQGSANMQVSILSGSIIQLQCATGTFILMGNSQGSLQFTPSNETLSISGYGTVSSTNSLTLRGSSNYITVGSNNISMQAGGCWLTLNSNGLALANGDIILPTSGSSSGAVWVNGGKMYYNYGGTDYEVAIV